jgi:hypothetical protein
VDAAERGRGIGGAIVGAVLDRVAGIQTVGLDATPSGRSVYERLGFVAASALARVGGRVPDASSAGPVPVEAADLGPIATFDADAFGADRSRALRWAWESAPALAWCVKDGSAVVGYSLGREGVRAVHVGPVVAPDAAMARALVGKAAAAAGGRDVMLDVPIATPGWVAALHDLGLREQRPFTRMYRAGGRAPGHPERTFAVFGPELG